MKERLMITKTFRTKEQKAARLKQCAGVYDRTESDIINEALDQYLDHQDWLARTIASRAAKFRQNPDDVLQHADVVAHLSTKT